MRRRQADRPQDRRLVTAASIRAFPGVLLLPQPRLLVRPSVAPATRHTVGAAEDAFSHFGQAHAPSLPDHEANPVLPGVGDDTLDNSLDRSFIYGSDSYKIVCKRWRFLIFGTVMELLTEPAVWLGLVSVGVLAAWLKGFLNQFLPPPQRAWLAIANSLFAIKTGFRTESPPPEDRFRFVLCWLEDDTTGRDTKTVGQAFTGVEGVELVRSARIVKASGAADEWLPAMRKGARTVLDEWKADLAVAGSVKESGKALNLWVVPREGDGTLRRADRAYELKNVTLQKEFHEDLRAQLVAVALRAVAPLADTEVRGRVLEKELTAATEKLATLLKGATITGGDRRAALSLAYGDALAALGERESGRKRLEQAVDAYTQALEVFTRDGAPLAWAGTQNNLGNVLRTLGERESGSERLEQAADAYTQALKECTRESVPFDWAMTQNNLGNVLANLGERETGRKRLEQAVDAYTQALEVFTRNDEPLQWAMTQNNLGNALRILGERETGRDRLEQAIGAYTEALKERTRERVPFDWAVTQNNLGNALANLGKRESVPSRLEQAVGAYTQALEVSTHDDAPLQWAMTQNDLGNALQALGELVQSPTRLEQAIAAYAQALEERTRECAPFQWAATQNNLGIALQTLGALEKSPTRVEQAVDACTEALKECTRESVPFDWAVTQNSLGIALQTLGALEKSPERMQQAIAAYTEALQVFDAEATPQDWQMAQNNLALARNLLREMEAEPGSEDIPG